MKLVFKIIIIIWKLEKRYMHSHCPMENSFGRVKWVALFPPMFLMKTITFMCAVITVRIFAI